MVHAVYWKDYLFSVELLLQWWKSIDRICVGLFLGFLLCLFVCLFINMLSWYYSSVVSLKIGWSDFLSFFFKVFLDILISLPFHGYFRNNLSMLKKSSWNFDQNCLTSIDQPGEKRYHCYVEFPICEQFVLSLFRSSISCYISFITYFFIWDSSE